MVTRSSVGEEGHEAVGVEVAPKRLGILGNLHVTAGLR